MKVRELIERLQQHPPEMEVALDPVGNEYLSGVGYVVTRDYVCPFDEAKGEYSTTKQLAVVLHATLNSPFIKP